HSWKGAEVVGYPQEAPIFALLGREKMLASIMDDGKMQRQLTLELRDFSTKLCDCQPQGGGRVKPGLGIAVGIDRRGTAGSHREEPIGKGGCIVSAPMQRRAHQKAAGDRLPAAVTLAFHCRYHEGKAR